MLLLIIPDQSMRQENLNGLIIIFTENEIAKSVKNRIRKNKSPFSSYLVN